MEQEDTMKSPTHCRLCNSPLGEHDGLNKPFVITKHFQEFHPGTYNKVLFAYRQYQAVKRAHGFNGYMMGLDA